MDVLFRKPKKRSDGVSDIVAYTARRSAEGASRVRARGKGAIKQARKAYHQAGVTPPASLRLPTPKRKPK